MMRTILTARKLPFLASLVVVTVSAVSFRVFYLRQRAYVEARNARLLAVPERTLLRSFGSDGGQLERTLWREGADLKVALRRPAAPGTAGAVAAEPITIHLKDLLRQVPLGTDAFDLLLVADDEGRVLEQLGNEALARQSLAGLRRADDKPLDPAELWNAAQLVDARLSGREVSLFCRPVVLQHEARGPGSAVATRRGFVFCGLASGERMRDAALCISPLLVAALVGVVLLTLLTPPFLKPFLMSRRERLRFADVYALSLSAFLGLLLLTLAVLDASLFASLSDAADGQLAMVATRAQDHLHEELQRARRQLQAFDQDAARENGGRCTNAFGLMGEPAAGCRGLAVEEIDYPFFESASWASRDGEQLLRWRTDRRDVPLLSVASRDYFKAVRDDRLWRPPDAGAEGGAMPYFVQAVRTFSKGETRAVVSMRSGGVPGALMASITTSLVSITQPVLPPRVGLAVIDPAGEVLFHSEPSQSLTHNLFEESGQDADLRAAVAAGRSGFFSLRYWGRAHRFYTTRLSDTPWTVVAFRKEDLLRGVNVQVLEGALALVLLHTVVIFALPSLLYVAIVRKRVGWLVPSAAQGPVYAELAATCAIAFVLLSTRLRPANATEAVSLGFAAPWAALGLAAAAFRLRLSWRLGGLLGPERRWRAAAWLSQRYRVGHVVAALLFWALLAVFPGVAFTKAAAERELQALVELAGRHEARSLASREREAEVFYGQSLTGETPASGRPRPDEQLLRKRLQERLDLYQARLWTPRPGREASGREECWGTEDLPACDGWLCRALEAQRTALPNLDPASVELRYLSPVKVLCGGRVPAAASGSGRIGPWPTFWTLVGAWPFVLLALVSVPAAAWIRWCARHLLRAEVMRPRPRSLEDLKQGLLPRAFCVAASSLEIDRMLEGGWCLSVAPCDTALPEACLDASRPVVIDLRAFGEVDAVSREALLECAEAVMRAPRQQVYLAATTPASGLLDVRASSPLPAVEWQRWLRLFDQLPLVFLRAVHGAAGAESPDSREEQSARRLLGRSAGTSRTLLLADELRAVPRLRWLADHHLPLGAFEGVPPREILSRLSELADNEYGALWSASTPDEKLSLVQLCDEHFVNPRQVSAVGRLLDRGLLLRDPVLRPVSQSFALYVRESGVREEVEPLERPGDGLAWDDLQLPALTLAAVCGIVLFVSHPDLLDTSVPIVSALSATGVPILVRAAGILKDLASRSGGRALA